MHFDEGLHGEHQACILIFFVLTLMSHVSQLLTAVKYLIQSHQSLHFNIRTTHAY
jgi:hypothetical protein